MQTLLKRIVVKKWMSKKDEELICQNDLSKDKVNELNSSTTTFEAIIFRNEKLTNEVSLKKVVEKFTKGKRNYENMLCK